VEPVHLLAELRLSGGVVEQQPEPVRVLGGRAEQGVDAGVGVVAGADRLDAWEASRRR
jgi:hypothetical protein